MLTRVLYKKFNEKEYDKAILELSKDKKEKMGEFICAYFHCELTMPEYDEHCRNNGIPTKEDFCSTDEYIVLQFGPEKTVIADQDSGEILVVNTSELRVSRISTARADLNF